jgi:hypothetical protein
LKCPGIGKGLSRHDQQQIDRRATTLAAMVERHKAEA